MTGCRRGGGGKKNEIKRKPPSSYTKYDPTRNPEEDAQDVFVPSCPCTEKRGMIVKALSQVGHQIFLTCGFSPLQNDFVVI
jgi:hypothetical protein